MSAQKGPKVPGHLKRCVRCGEAKPRTEEHWYFYPASTNGKAYAHSRCKACGPAASRELRERMLATDPDRVRAKEAAYRERRDADPERRAIRTVYNREWQRRNRSNGGVRRSDGQPEGYVQVAAIREAVGRSNVPVVVIASRLGVTEGAVRHALQRDMMPAIRAVEILDVIGVFPAEVDL